MRDDIIKTIDFKQVRTIISKENSDIEEWRYCNLIPFMLLDPKTTYSVVYVMFRKSRRCGYSTAGTPEVMYKKIAENIDDSEQNFIIISNSSNNKKEGWYITRD